MQSLTIVIPNRNRHLDIVRRSLLSISTQLADKAKAVVVDYGSEPTYQQQLLKMVNGLQGIEIMLCPTQGQLWNKSRCINMVLIQCETPFFMVSDMDMIWHPDFLRDQMNTWKLDAACYYPVGMLSASESKMERQYHDFHVKFITSQEATGITVFPTAALKSIRGFDEFYHGWGSEDTDAHVRLQAAGNEVRFRKSDTSSNHPLYFKHQWHQKNYRKLGGADPHHTHQERVSGAYQRLTERLLRTTANHNRSWGEKPQAVPKGPPDFRLTIPAIVYDVKAALHQLEQMAGLIQLTIQPLNELDKLKNKIKSLRGKKVAPSMSMEQVNDTVLEWIIRHRHHRYRYDYGKSMIVLTILQ